MKRRRIFTGCLLIVCIFFLFSVSFGAGPRYGGTLRIGVRVPQFTRLDARYLTTETMIPSAVMIYDYLFNWGPGGYKSLIPQLATGYETEDNRVWIIHLRKGVKFHNGREMTAEDVKINFDWRINTPKGWKPVKFKELIKYLKGAEVIDRYTVKIILEKPYAPLLRVLAYALRGIAPPEEVEKWGSKFTMHPVGTGPYKVAEIKPKQKLVLERFDGYWGPRPYIDKVIYKFYRSNDTRLIALQKGELDVAQLFEEAMPVLDKDPNLTYKLVISPFIQQKYYFNMRRWPMKDIRFRKAVWMGADWKNIAINTKPFKKGKYARTFLEYTPYFNPDAVSLVPKYNPEEAKRLVQAVEKDAGKKIPPIYWLGSSSTGKEAAELAKIQLAQIGIPLDLHLMSHANWFDKLLRDPKLEWDIGAYGAGFGVDPNMGFTYFLTDSKTAIDGKSLGGYSNPQLDKLISESEAVKDENLRMKMYHEGEKILLKDVAAIPVAPYTMLLAYNKKVKGFVINDTMNIYVTSLFSNMWIEE